MRAIRARFGQLSLYYKLIREILGITHREERENYGTVMLGAHWNETNTLTAFREALIQEGFSKEVELADAEYLKARLTINEKEGPITQEEWDRRWDEYVKNLPIKPYPVDAL